MATVWGSGRRHSGLQSWEQKPASLWSMFITSVLVRIASCSDLASLFQEMARRED